MAGMCGSVAWPQGHHSGAFDLPVVVNMSQSRTGITQPSPVFVWLSQLGLLTPLLQLVSDMAATPGDALYGLVDASQVATMGHSRGGKLAALHMISECVCGRGMWEGGVHTKVHSGDGRIPVFITALLMEQ